MEMDYQKWRNAEDLHPMPLCGGTIPLAPGPGPLVRFAFRVKSSRQGSHPQLSRFKRDASADWAT